MRVYYHKMYLNLINKLGHDKTILKIKQDMTRGRFKQADIAECIQYINQRVNRKAG